MNLFTVAGLRLAALGLVFLTACSSTPLTTTEVAGDKPITVATSSTATPIPPGAEVNTNQSLILGQGDQWVGRMVLDVGRDADIAYKFFYEIYPNRGWTLITAVRGEASLLVFSNAERSLSVEVKSGQFWGGGRVVITASPNRSAGSAPVPSMGTPLPALRP
ncbi:MAG: hypothetical protein QM527_10295 [Alphaproteobacteria bacterium]|nr:hypothetical protein [Alphaproteobacteria bacterium]